MKESVRRNIYAVGQARGLKSGVRGEHREARWGAVDRLEGDPEARAIYCAGWYSGYDEGAGFETGRMLRPHAQDADCRVGEDGCCRDCGIHHGAPCPDCGGRGFHAPDCREPARCGGCGVELEPPLSQYGFAAPDFGFRCGEC